MAVRIGINGFGRIGMMVAKAAMKRGDLEVVAANDLMPFESLALLFKRDSTHGVWEEDVEFDGSILRVGGREIKTFSEREPKNIPWGDLGVDIVIESSGVFTNRDAAAGHLEGGAKKVVISAPAKGADATFVYKVNHETYDPENHHVVSNASCTTNCIIPMVKVLQDNFGIESGFMTTVHAYTNDQRILDQAHRDLRRARSAAASIIPTTTGAAKAVGAVLPELAGKLNGFAMRVPVANVSVVDLVAEVGRAVTVEEVNSALKRAAEGELKGILAYTEEPLVSIDFNGDPHSAIVDGLSTMVMDGTMVKVVAWYDNEWGYSCRVVDLIAYMVAKGI